MKKNIVVFTGAGVSEESGIDTFRTDNGLWLNHKIEDVATPEGFKKDPELVNNFYNNLRSKLKDVKPNEAHMLISDLQDDYNVTVVTQNVDDLHERSGVSNVIHLHGELTKVRSISNPHEIIDWGYKPITDNDRGKNNSRLRPHIVWFGEYPFKVIEAQYVIEKADIMIVIGTSFSIGYTVDLVNQCGMVPIYFIDPNPDIAIFGGKDVTYIKEKAVKGMTQLYKILKNG